MKIMRTELLGDISVCDPPDSIPNSEVKASCADDSMGSPHVKVGHRQAFKFKRPQPVGLWGLLR